MENLTNEEIVLQKEIQLFLELKNKYPNINLISLITEIWEKLRIEETEAINKNSCGLIDIFLNSKIDIEDFKKRINQLM